MHEVSVAIAIVEQIEERADTRPDEFVRTVYLQIGAMSGVHGDALQFAWELATAGTMLEGAALVIERVPLTIACSRCERPRTIDGAPIPVCPVCGVPSNAIISGRELSIAKLEVCDANPVG